MSNLIETEIHALHEALDDEYHAWATYDRVIADYGDTPPFSNIREAEARHIEALLTIFLPPRSANGLRGPEGSSVSYGSSVSRASGLAHRSGR